MSKSDDSVQVGDPHPLGASLRPGGVSFCVMAHHAEWIDLLLYDHVDADEPARVIRCDPSHHRTNDYWHCFVPGIQVGQLYAYRAHGPYDPDSGFYFDSDKVLLDSYGKGVAVPTAYDREAACKAGRNDRTACKSVVTDDRAYDWEGDRPLRRPFSQTVIYEMHVRGFTRHPSSGVAAERRGTYAGLIEKIPYLVDLGITAIELMPVFQYDWQEAPGDRINYWGYSPMSFFAPHHAYSSDSHPLGVLDEFRDMVKAVHRAGIEVILDVVYNHTSEAGTGGPITCWRGLDNRGYYLLQDNNRVYANYSGTGNVLNANRAVVRRLIRDSLHYWVQVMHVDGFRFDLASILSRDITGHPLPNPPLLWDIDTDPILAGAKLIVEAWDPGGLYQVGSFVGNYWKEWNGKFRDDVRAFVRGDAGMVPKVAKRLIGSPDLYAHERQEAEQSVNFITAHDGFTLNDLVSYNHKHNEANGHANGDGFDYNLSCNYGEEGPTDDPEIEAVRSRQIRNMLAITLLSLGAPMLTMGDEARRTQNGNNNAYCQDNELSWLDWTLVERHADLRRFVRQLIQLRFQRDAVRTGDRVPLIELLERARVRFHGVHVNHPDWSRASRSLALSATSLSGHIYMYFALNMYWEPLSFELPAPPRTSPWRRGIDTGLAPPDDITGDLATAPVVSGPSYLLESRSILALFSPVTRPPGSTGTERRLDDE